MFIYKFVLQLHDIIIIFNQKFDLFSEVMSCPAIEKVRFEKKILHYSLLLFLLTDNFESNDMFACGGYHSLKLSFWTDNQETRKH